MKRCEQELGKGGEWFGGAWLLLNFVSGLYDMLSQGKYQLCCQVMEYIDEGLRAGENKGINAGIM